MINSNVSPQICCIKSIKGWFTHHQICGVLHSVDWTGLDWTCKTWTSKTRTCKTRTSKTWTSKTRKGKTRTSKSQHFFCVLQFRVLPVRVLLALVLPVRVLLVRVLQVHVLLVRVIEVQSSPRNTVCPDLLARICKGNLSNAKRFGLICFPRICFQGLIYCDKELLWLLNVIEDVCF